MKFSRLALFPTFLLLFICAGFHSLAQNGDQLKDSVAIATSIKQYEEAWNQHDPAALARQYHTDASWVNWFGDYAKGRDSIQAHYQQVHSTYFKSTHFTTISIDDVDFVKPDVAIAHVRTQLTGDSRFPGKTFLFRRTLVYTKRDAVWRVLAGQNAKMPDPK